MQDVGISRTLQGGNRRGSIACEFIVEMEMNAAPVIDAVVDVLLREDALTFLNPTLRCLELSGPAAGRSFEIPISHGNKIKRIPKAAVRQELRPMRIGRVGDAEVRHVDAKLTWNNGV